MPGSTRRMTVTRAAAAGTATRFCEALAGPAGAVPVAAIFEPDAILHGVAPSGDTSVGLEGLADLLDRLDRVFPLRRCEVEDTVVAGETVAVRWRLALAADPHAVDMQHAGCVRGAALLNLRGTRICELWTNFGRWWL